MSEIKVNSIKGVGSTDAAITINNSDGTCTANLTNKPNRNLIINGAMQVAQRGTSATESSSGYYSLDRFALLHTGTDESPTQAQVDVASGTTPYTQGFRKAFRVTNGNQTSGAGASDNISIRYKVEAQDIANSGWNYLSSSSNITISFWIKSSVAQNFYFNFIAPDGTSYNYPMETGSLSANTWTKVTKTISGNANLTFNNDNGVGLQIDWWPFAGTSYTDGGVTLNQWVTYSSGGRVPDYTTTWYTTNDATFEITGVQLEVGSVATDFEHRSFGQELALCQRYYYRATSDAVGQRFGSGNQMTSSAANILIPLPVTMRIKPTALETSGTASDYSVARASTYDICNAVPTFDIATPNIANILTNQTISTVSVGQCVQLRANSTNCILGFSAEL